MTWLRVDDRAPMHPKVIRLRGLPDIEPMAVLGFVVAAAAWSGAHDTDCEIPLGVGEMVDPSRWERYARAAVKVGMLSKPKRLSTGDRGWVVCIDDGLLHLMSRAEKEKRKHRAVSRRDQTRADLHLRDSDLCRYCGTPVNPKDGLGGMGREFDHPDPDVADVVVVSCRRCNLFKGGRTVEEAEMELRPPPAPEDRHWHESTLAWLANRGIDPERPAGPIADPAFAARSPRASAAATERAPAQPVAAAHQSTPPDELEAALRALAPVMATYDSTSTTTGGTSGGGGRPASPGSGRDGSGLVEKGGVTAGPARPPPRRRGKRGRRGRGPRSPITPYD